MNRWTLAVAAFFMVVGSAGCLPFGKRGADKPESERASKVVILNLRGPLAKKIRASLVRAAGGEFELVPQARYQRTARRLKARGMKPKRIAKVAQELGIDAVVDARVRPRKKSRVAVMVRVRDGRTGKVIERFEVVVKRKLTKKKTAAKLRKPLVAAVRAVEPLEEEPESAETASAEEPPARESTAKQDKQDKQDKKARGDRAKKAAAEPAPEKREEPEELAPLDPDRFNEKTDNDGHVIDDESPEMKPAKYH